MGLGTQGREQSRCGAWSTGMGQETEQWIRQGIWGKGAESRAMDQKSDAAISGV